MARLLLFIIFIPLCAAASDIEDYTPPEMFGIEATEEAFPPLPPRRPEKFMVSERYLDELKEREKKSNISSQDLIRPTAQDILDQINPQ